MSPVGGVGINYAVQDAVVAANVLTEPLKRGRLRLRDLAAVQRQREIPTRIIQGFQRLAQEQIVTRALAGRARCSRRRSCTCRSCGTCSPGSALGVWPVHLKT